MIFSAGAQAVIMAVQISIVDQIEIPMPSHDLSLLCVYETYLAKRTKEATTAILPKEKVRITLNFCLGETCSRMNVGKGSSRIARSVIGLIAAGARPRTLPFTQCGG